MTIQGAASAIWRHHACEVVLFALLAAPVLSIRPSTGNAIIVAGFFLSYFGLSYLSDIRTSLVADDDGVEYLAGGRDRVFIAWSEMARIVPRRFRGWPAEDAIVLLDDSDAPLLVAAVSMFDRRSLDALKAHAERFVEVDQPVVLSPFTGRAHGVRHPELVPQRTSERFLASSIGGFLLAAFVAVVLVTIVE